MTKILLIAIAFAVAFWMLRGIRRRAQDDAHDAQPSVEPGAQDMVRCARCGIHLPRDEGVSSQEQYFCSKEHEREFLDTR